MRAPTPPPTYPPLAHTVAAVVFIKVLCEDMRMLRSHSLWWYLVSCLLAATERSGQVVSHVDAIGKYNSRLSSLLDKEKSKDDAMRTMEKQLYADKLKVIARSYFVRD